MNRKNVTDPHGYQASGSATSYSTSHTLGLVRARNLAHPVDRRWTRD